MRNYRSKIKSPAALMKKLASRKGSEKLVFTNGVFDLLHKGHVEYLERARKLGTQMVVALNTDAAVKRLKGKDRPINLLADRLEVMAALESVDWVTWFDEDTPILLIRACRPNVLVKGGDWKPEQIVGGADVLSWKGKVKSLPYAEGRSTTRMIEKARKH